MDTDSIRNLVAFSDLQGECIGEVRRFIQSDFTVSAVKSNPKRSIFLLTDGKGRMLYLKLFQPRRFPAGIFRSYAAAEYGIARRLASASVPVVRYLGWAKLKNGGEFCVSEGLPHVIPGRQYFFQTARFDPGKRGIFLERLAGMTCILLRNHFYHSDFHTGNLLFDTESNEMYLVDPWGIREVFFFLRSQREEMCSPWMELREYLSDGEIMEGLLSSSLSGSKCDALDLAGRAAVRYRKQADAAWGRVQRRILSGRSKFATLEMRGNDRFYWRHTEWFAPPEKLEVDPAWKVRRFLNADEAQTLWLDSFRRSCAEKPLLWTVRADGTSELYFSADK